MAETTFSGRPSFSFIFNIRSTGTDTQNNRSTVNFSIDVRSNQGLGTFSFASSNRVGATVDGQGDQIFSTLDFRNRPAGTTFRVYERNITVNHNSDGSKTVNWNASGSYSVFGSASLSGSFALPTIPRAPNPPATVTANSPVLRTIAVSWDAASGGAGVSNYDVDRIENNTSWVRILTGTTSRNTTSSNLNPGSTYRFRVRANGPGGSSGYRESNSQTIALAATPPSINISRTLRTVEVVLGESTPLDSGITITSYSTQKRESTNGGVTFGIWGDTRTLNTTDRTVVYTNLNSESTYQFRGRANTNLGSSAYSASGTVFIPGNPDPPENVLALRFGTAILIAITPPISDNGAPVLTYTIERREAPARTTSWSAWGSTEVISSSTASILKDIIELKKTYQYRVFATNEEGDSEIATESDSVYIPKVVNIYERDPRAFRNPTDYKRYDATINGWVGLSIAKKFTGGQWVEID